MRYEEISISIKNAINRYERERGIETKEVMELQKFEDIAFFGGMKTDGTATMFIAYKTTKWHEDSWRWWCPSENQSKVLNNDFHDYYAKIDNYNEIHRKTT